MVKNFTPKKNYGIDDLLEIMVMLRSPDGCPWDAEQTHQSIKKNFIEETYEVIEAINKDDKALMREELGDVLLQVVFHARMEEEQGSFNFNDVADGICKKLVERHPHVFGEVQVSGTEDVLRNWEDIKNRSKGQDTQTKAMNDIPRELPALMRATKIQKKAKKAGFDWDSLSGALEKLDEELKELHEAVNENDARHTEEELGDLLFAAVNVSRFINCDAEEALTAANDKFMSRFALVEKMASERGVDMKEASLEELDKLWDEAKAILKSN